MSLEALRAKVAFHNSIDVWIALREDSGKGWNDTDGYRAFVSRLRAAGMALRPFSICAHEAGAVEKEKTEFAEKLAALKGADPDCATYTIRLNGETVAALRSAAAEIS